MPDKNSKTDPFKPEQPRIPGVPFNVPAKEGAPAAPPTRGRIAPPVNIPPTWIMFALVGVLVVGVAIAWWNHSSAAKEPAAAADAAPTAKPAAEPPKPVEKLGVAPGEVATTDELAEPWSSKRFIFRDAKTGRETPGVVVHLPDGEYWGLSLREPFGSCEMEYVTDLEKIEREYHYRAAHPMVGDPCNKTVFDLTKYGAATSGLVRGEIVQGRGVRPPIAIEIRTQGKRVLAVRMERF